MVSGVTDYLDGKIARAWGQTSRLGQLLDPAADRLYILATLIGLTVRDIVPLWLTLLLVGRDVLLASTLPVLRRHGYGPLPVHFLGKAATFNLLYAFPLLLLGEWRQRWSATSRTPFGWAFAIWGTALYWWAGVLYLVQVRDLVRDRTRLSSAATQGVAGVKAVVMAGGEGTRLRPMTVEHAQAAAPHRQQADHGARPAAAARGTASPRPSSPCSSSPAWSATTSATARSSGMTLHYATEETPLGTAGSVKNAEDLLRDDTFLVISGDALTDIDLTDLVQVPPATRARWSRSA